MNLENLTKAQLIEKYKADKEANDAKLKTLYDGVRQKDSKIQSLENDIIRFKDNEVAKIKGIQDSVNEKFAEYELKLKQLAKEYVHVHAGLVGNAKIVMILTELKNKQNEALDEITKIYQGIYIEEVE